jgi:hypothetical protein
MLPLALVAAIASSPTLPGGAGGLPRSVKREFRSQELRAQQDMKTIADQIVALNTKIYRARQLVAEHQKSARSLRGRGDRASKTSVLIYDLTHWLHGLEARRDDLFRQSRLMAQGGARLLRATNCLHGHPAPSPAGQFSVHSSFPVLLAPIARSSRSVVGRSARIPFSR